MAYPPPSHPSRTLPAADGTPDRERPADGRPEVPRQSEEGTGLVEGGARRPGADAMADAVEEVAVLGGGGPGGRIRA